MATFLDKLFELIDLTNQDFGDDEKEEEKEEIVIIRQLFKRNFEQDKAQEAYKRFFQSRVFIEYLNVLNDNDLFKLNLFRSCVILAIIIAASKKDEEFKENSKTVIHRILSCDNIDEIRDETRDLIYNSYTEDVYEIKCLIHYAMSIAKGSNYSFSIFVNDITKSERLKRDLMLDALNASNGFDTRTKFNNLDAVRLILNRKRYLNKDVKTEFSGPALLSHDHIKDYRMKEMYAEDFVNNADIYIGKNRFSIYRIPTADIPFIAGISMHAFKFFLYIKYLLSNFIIRDFPKKGILQPLITMFYCEYITNGYHSFGEIEAALYAVDSRFKFPFDNKYGLLESIPYEEIRSYIDIYQDIDQSQLFEGAENYKLIIKLAKSLPKRGTDKQIAILNIVRIMEDQFESHIYGGAIADDIVSAFLKMLISVTLVIRQGAWYKSRTTAQTKSGNAILNKLNEEKYSSLKEIILAWLYPQQEYRDFLNYKDLISFTGFAIDGGSNSKIYDAILSYSVNHNKKEYVKKFDFDDQEGDIKDDIYNFDEEFRRLRDSFDEDYYEIEQICGRTCYNSAIGMKGSEQYRNILTRGFYRVFRGDSRPPQDILSEFNGFTSKDTGDQSINPFDWDDKFFAERTGSLGVSTSFFIEQANNYAKTQLKEIPGIEDFKACYIYEIVLSPLNYGYLNTSRGIGEVNVARRIYPEQIKRVKMLFGFKNDIGGNEYFSTAFFECIVDVEDQLLAQARKLYNDIVS